MQAERHQLAESYLHHILIAAELGDAAAPFRDFLDNWFAFEHARPFLTSGNRPKWFNNPCAWEKREMLGAMHFRSVEAQSIIEQAQSDTVAFRVRTKAKDPAVRLMVDHAIPLRVIRDRIFADVALHDIGALRDFLRASYRLGVITSKEDAGLNRHGLRHAMPAGWDGEEPYARYRACGIVGKGAKAP